MNPYTHSFVNNAMPCLSSYRLQYYQSGLKVRNVGVLFLIQGVSPDLRQHTYIHTYIQLRNRTPRAWQSSSLPAAHQSARPRPTSSRSAGTTMLSLACTSLSCLGHRGERGSPPRAYGSRQRSRQRPTGGSPVLGQSAAWPQASTQRPVRDPRRHFRGPSPMPSFAALSATDCPASSRDAGRTATIEIAARRT